MQLPTLPSDTDRVLVVVDALRFDRTEGSLGATPAMDRLREQSWVFTRAYTHGIETRTAMPALLRAMQPEGPWLGERLPELSHGFFSGNAWIDTPLTSGFDPVVRISYSYLEPRVDGARLTDRYADWLRAHPEPTLAVLHYMDVHVPYESPGGQGRALAIHGPIPPNAGPEDLATTVRRYDDGVRYFDTFLARLLDLHVERGRPWMLVLTADHGELLGEHGLLGHGGGHVVPELVHVPLIVRWPDAKAARISEVVGLGAIPGLLEGKGPSTGPVWVRPGSVVRGDRLLTAEATWDLAQGTHQDLATPRSLEMPVFPSYKPPQDGSGRMRGLGYLE